MRSPSLIALSAHIVGVAAFGAPSVTCPDLSYKAAVDAACQTVIQNTIFYNKWQSNVAGVPYGETTLTKPGQTPPVEADATVAAAYNAMWATNAVWYDPVGTIGVVGSDIFPHIASRIAELPLYNNAATNEYTSGGAIYYTNDPHRAAFILIFCIPGAGCNKIMDIGEWDSDYKCTIMWTYNGYGVANLVLGLGSTDWYLKTKAVHDAYGVAVHGYWLSPEGPATYNALWANITDSIWIDPIGVTPIYGYDAVIAHNPLINPPVVTTAIKSYFSAHHNKSVIDMTLCLNDPTPFGACVPAGCYQVLNQITTDDDYKITGMWTLNPYAIMAATKAADGATITGTPKPAGI
jgi:hypothetical protein